jgi:methanethiol S-methyltransferase
MNSGFFPILLACAVYGALHSLLASLPAKAWAARRGGHSGARFYRLFFNLTGGITLLPVFYLVYRLPDVPLYQIPFPWVLLTGLLQLAAVIGLLVGVRQTGALEFLGLDAFLPERQPRPASLVCDGLYRYVRHPLYTCGLVFLWLTPVMTWNLLALALGLTAYILTGIYFEERKLLREFGEEYAEYCRRTPMLIPFRVFP